MDLVRPRLRVVRHTRCKITAAAVALANASDLAVVFRRLEWSEEEADEDLSPREEDLRDGEGILLLLLLLLGQVLASVAVLDAWQQMVWELVWVFQQYI